MVSQMLTVQTGNGPREVATVWRGQVLAVHRPVVSDGKQPAPKRWAITHTPSGLAMAGTIATTKAEAVALAKLWDTAAGEINPSNPRGWRYLETWRLDVATVEHRRIAELMGPVLPDHPTASDVAAAVAAAVGATFEPATEAEAAEPWPAAETVAADRLRNGPQGPEMRWRGQWWPVPSVGEVEGWLFDSTAETPDGRTVEPDHPEAWPYLLGLI